MTTLSEPARAGDFLLFEEEHHYSRGEVTIAAGADLSPGTVLGKITASGKYTACVETASDGSETAAAVLLTPAKAASADVTDALIIARHARVKRGGLIFDASFDDTAKRDAAVAELKSVGILTDV